MREFLINFHAASALIFGMAFLPLWAEAPAEPQETERNIRLIACPDCSHPVSKRAVFCPACGCPGEAIAEEVKRLREAERPGPFVEVESDAGIGHGIALKMEDGTFVAFPFESLGGLSRLTLRNRQGETVPYRGIEIAVSDPFVRLPVESDDLLYLTLDADAASRLTWDERNRPVVSPAPDAESPKVAWDSLNWKPIRPAELRGQIGKIRAAAEAGPDQQHLDPLEETDWATSWLKEMARPTQTD